MLLQTSQVDHSDARDAVRCDATQASQNTPVAPPTRLKKRFKPSSRTPASNMTFTARLLALAATASAIITPRPRVHVRRGDKVPSLTAQLGLHTEA